MGSELTLISSCLPSSTTLPPAAMRPPANSTSNKVSPYLEKSSSALSRPFTPACRFLSRLSWSVVSTSLASSKISTTAVAKEAGSKGTAIFLLRVLIWAPLQHTSEVDLTHGRQQQRKQLFRATKVRLSDTIFDIKSRMGARNMTQQPHQRFSDCKSKRLTQGLASLL